MCVDCSNGTRLFIGLLDSNVYALDTKDGSSKWNYTTDFPFAQASFDDTTLFISSAHTLYVLNTTANGSVIWRREFDFKLTSAVLSHDGAILYIGETTTTAGNYYVRVEH